MTLNSHIQNILKNSKKDTEWKKEAEERLKARTESKKSGLIATQLAIYMAEKGISQTALGKMTGVSPQQISKIMKGRENLTLATIEKIEDALGIQLIQVNILEEAELKRLELVKEKEIKNRIDSASSLFLELQRNQFVFSQSLEMFLDMRIYNNLNMDNLFRNNIENVSFCDKTISRIGRKPLRVHQALEELSEASMVFEPKMEYSKFSMKDHE